jgi:hypothetical protein
LYLIATDAINRRLKVEFFGQYPTSSGSYKIVTFPNSADEIGMSFDSPGGDYYFTQGTDNKTAHVTVANGKIKVTAFDAEAKNNSNIMTTISCNIFE